MRESGCDPQQSLLGREEASEAALLTRSRVSIPSGTILALASAALTKVHDGTLLTRAAPVHGEATLPEDVDDHPPDPLHVRAAALRSAPEGHGQLAGSLGAVNVLLGVKAEPTQPGIGSAAGMVLLDA